MSELSNDPFRLAERVEQLLQEIEKKNATIRRLKSKLLDSRK